MTARMPGPGSWYYELAYCDCSCQIVTAGRNHLQCGEWLYCEKHKRVVKAVRVEAATLAQQDALCEMSQESETNKCQL